MGTGGGIALVLLGVLGLLFLWSTGRLVAAGRSLVNRTTLA